MQYTPSISLREPAPPVSLANGTFYGMSVKYKENGPI